MYEMHIHNIKLHLGVNFEAYKTNRVVDMETNTIKSMATKCGIFQTVTPNFFNSFNKLLQQQPCVLSTF